MSKTLADVHFATGNTRRPPGRPPKIEEVDAQMSFLRILEVINRPALEKSAADSPAVAISCEFNPTWVEVVVGYQDDSRSSCTVDTSLRQNLQLRSAFGIHSLYPLEAGSNAFLEFPPIKPLGPDD